MSSQHAPQSPSSEQEGKRSVFAQLSTSMKALLITVSVLLVAVIVTVIAVTVSRPSAAEVAADRASTPITESDTHFLDRVGDDAPTVVEFLDFECESCGVMYPIAEDVRAQYKGKINYAVRYFPLSGHFNSMNAAVAVEAAAQQGKYEEMYHQMFETQREWGEQHVSAADTFRGYAEQLGLDLAQYDAAVADPKTQDRVQRDYDAGQKLGVTGTPTFFVNGAPLELVYQEDLGRAVEEALAAR